MPEESQKTQYICMCGGMDFEIFAAFVQCSKCKAKYNYYHGYLLIPKDFNGRKESLRRKEG